jgi:tRNA (guanine-N7-)-methyltransferase
MRAGRQALFDDLLPKIKVDVETALPGQLKPNNLFDTNVDEVWLEVGFGGGEHLIARAVANPNVGLIGCEPFVDGIGKVLADVDRREIRNIRLYDDDARFLLDVLSDQSVDRAFLLYPDPWPKKRHNKRRFVNEETIAQLARVMKPGGIWLMATDIQDYARWMLSYMTKSQQFDWTAGSASDWRVPPENWPGTRYEQKAMEQGRQPIYLTFQRLAENPHISR